VEKGEGYGVAQLSDIWIQDRFILAKTWKGLKMTNKVVENKPSETALFAALRRTIAHKEYKNEKFGPDYLAEYFLPAHYRFFLRFTKIRENTKERLDGFLPGLNEYMIARTAYFDHVFVDALNNNISQIVLLGAGYDTRAYRFEALNQGTKIFELDIPPTQNRKKECLRKGRIEISQHVTLLPIDFNSDSLKEVLGIAGYKSDLKTLFIWEGVTYYLEVDSVDATLEFVSHNSHPESTVVFDYTVSIPEENMNEYYGVKEFSQTMKEHHADEELTFSINEGELESFLEQRGLKMIDHLNNKEIERKVLKDENGTLLGQITGHFRFLSASPKSI
jgi:methyltransferase (TIGR00027 family)